MGVSVFPAPAGGGGGGPLKFAISIGATGNNGFTLAEPVSAGVYSITSDLSDSSYDIYFLGKNGQEVGYSNTAEITASDAIYAVSIIGGDTNDVITFERSQTAVPTTEGEAVGAGAYITSVNVSTLPDVNDAVTITGGNFAADLEVYFVGTDTLAREAKSVTKNSSTEAVAVRPDVFPVAVSPFAVQVINPGATPPVKTGAYILADAISAGAGPTWVTPAGQLAAGYTAGAAYSFQLEATDAEGGVTYSVTSGALLPGLTLSSSGLISGTCNTGGLEAVFTVTVTDEGSNTASREFSIAEVAALSGGTVIDAGGFRYHLFTSSGTLLHTGGSKDVEVAIVGGGAGAAGGFSLPDETGGGGGGGGSNTVVQLNISAGNHVVTVGAGGAGGNGTNTDGVSSQFTPAQGSAVVGVGGAKGIVSTGGNGGTPSGGRGGNGGGNGGGGTNGGSTYLEWVSATSTGQLIGGLGYYGGGGGGGATFGTGGGGGRGGGGVGRSWNAGNTNGGVNTGGGGGGGNRPNATNGAAGGSGVVIVRYVP